MYHVHCTMQFFGYSLMMLYSLSLSLSPFSAPSFQILTTHAMEEADHLCTRIGIMNFGRLRCLGTQNRLKSKFGTGYQLAFNCAPGRVSDVEKFVGNNLQKAVHIETYAGMVK